MKERGLGVWVCLFVFFYFPFSSSFVSLTLEKMDFLSSKNTYFRFSSGEVCLNNSRDFVMLKLGLTYIVLQMRSRFSWVNSERKRYKNATEEKKMKYYWPVDYCSCIFCFFLPLNNFQSLLGFSRLILHILYQSLPPLLQFDLISQIQKSCNLNNFCIYFQKKWTFLGWNEVNRKYLINNTHSRFPNTLLCGVHLLR